MPTYTQPGVHIEEVRGTGRSIEARATSTAVFIGGTAKGPMSAPSTIKSWSDYGRQFGGMQEIEQKISGSRFFAGDHMGLAVRAFFKNGGKKAYLLSIANHLRGTLPDLIAYTDAFKTISKISDINIILLPGLMWNKSGAPIIEAAIAHCEALNNRMVIFDIPPGYEISNSSDLHDLKLPTSSYAATYYPWPLPRNSFYQRVTNPGAARRLLASPAAYAAGIWSKIDEQRGVWKAPAGKECQLWGANKLEYTVQDNVQVLLNPVGINALRHLPGIGSVVWGARTLAIQTHPEWRYISVRRTAIMIEQSVTAGIEWAVFEPNDERLWAALRACVETFLNEYYRAGAFQGEKSDNAYYVRCGLGATMTQQDIGQGVAIVEVGFAPLKPAEFLILRIRQKAG